MENVDIFYVKLFVMVATDDNKFKSPYKITIQVTEKSTKWNFIVRDALFVIISIRIVERRSLTKLNAFVATNVLNFHIAMVVLQDVYIYCSKIYAIHLIIRKMIEYEMVDNLLLSYFLLLTFSNSSETILSF